MQQLDRSKQPKAATSFDWTLPEPSFKTLKNGIKFQTLEVGNQDIFRLDLVFQAGRIWQTDLLQALFTCSMLKEGTSTYSSLEIAEILDTHGAILDVTCAIEYSYVTLYSLNKHAKTLLPLIYSIVTEPTFPNQELELIVDHNKQYLQVQLEKVSYLASRKMSKALFGENHPYSTQAELSDFDKINREMIQHFFDSRYSNNTCMISLAGQLNAELISLIEKQFGNHPFGNQEAKILPVKIKEGKRVTQRDFFIPVEESQQCAVLMGAPCMNIFDKDFFGMKFLIVLLGGYFGSRLMANIREKEGLTYGIYSDILPMPHAGVYQIVAETDGKYVTQLKASVKRELSKLQKELIPAEELERVRQYMLGEMCRSNEGIFALTESWIYLYTHHLPKEHYSQMVEKIKTISAQELLELANKYLHTDDLTVVVAGKTVITSDTDDNAEKD
ncbi:MAG: pitrilysin family protein [Bacteroidaceae bacterium]